MSDLIKAHEGNDDVNASDPLKIHWRKYNMMGGFVATTLQCKAQCLNSNDYNFPERPAIAELIVRYPVMSIEVCLYLSYLVLKKFHMYFSFRCKNLVSNHTTMNLMSITPLLPSLVSLVSVNYSSGKKCVFLETIMNCCKSSRYIENFLSDILVAASILEEYAVFFRTFSNTFTVLQHEMGPTTLLI